MSIFSRLQAALQARANQVADEIEDPKASLDYSLARLEESRNQIIRSLVEVGAAKNQLIRQRDQLAGALNKYGEQAQTAVNVGRDDLARLVLSRKQEAESRQTELDTNIANLERQEESLRQSQVNLEHKIALFRSKKEELKAIYDSSRAQLQVREAVSGISRDLTDVGSTIQRIEARIQDMQSRSDAIEGLISQGAIPDVLGSSSDDVGRQLELIGRQQAIEDELAQLKGEKPNIRVVPPESLPEKTEGNEEQ